MDPATPTDGGAPTALPAYQARLLEGATPRTSSLSRSSSSRHNILSNSFSSKGSLAATSAGGPFSVGGGVDPLARTGSARWNGRGHTSGSKSVDVTRGFWQDREKQAAEESPVDGGIPSAGVVGGALGRKESRGSETSSAGGEGTSASMVSFPSASSFASTATSTGTGPTYSPPTDPHTTRFGTPPPSERSASPGSSQATTPRAHRRANSAQPSTFVFQPSSATSPSASTSSFALGGQTTSPFLRQQVTGDRSSSPVVGRAMSFDNNASSPAATPPPSLSRASSITSRFAGRTTPTQQIAFPSSPVAHSPATNGATGTEAEEPVFRSSYARERHARLLSTSSSGSSSSLTNGTSEVAAAAVAAGPPVSAPPALTAFNPAPTYRYTPSSPSIPTSPAQPSSPVIPLIREPLGPRRGPAARLGRHMPRIASGDGGGMGEENEQPPMFASGGSPAPGARGVPSSLGRSESLMFNGGKYGGDGSMGRGVMGIKEGDEVIGMKGRRRLPLAQSSLNSVSSSPSLRLTTATIERTRKEIIAEEYLTHVGEALQWVEGVIQQDLGFGVVEFEEKLRDGVVLAKVAEKVGAKGGKKIFEDPKLQWRHSDNIIMFLNFTQSPEVGLPKNFIFETIDLYEKKNLPKVIFCIHSLSHVLANRGLVEKIGNLSGQLQFTDEQLQAASKGLSGQAMPNFKSIGKDLAKEMNFEPPAETEDEIRDRLLKEVKPSILALQAHAAGVLARMDFDAFTAELHDSSMSVAGLQAHIRANLVRARYAKTLAARQDQLAPLADKLVGFQSAARSAMTRRRLDAVRDRLEACDEMLARLQCHARGVLVRDRFDALRDDIAAQEEVFEDFVAQARGAAARRRQQKNLSTLASTHPAIVSFGAVARSALARNKFKAVHATLQIATPGLVGFQSRAKANLVRRNHQQLSQALANVSTISSAVNSQSIFRAALSRARKGEQKKEVEFVLPNFVGFQAMARRAYQKREFEWWRDHVRSMEWVADRLQCLFRGALARRAFYGRLNHFRRNTEAIVRLQAIRRGKGPREGFNGIRLGKNVKVSTIKNFGHLLDDSDAQFSDEARLNVLRQNVVETFRATLDLEGDVEALDQNIGLFAQNIAKMQGRQRLEPSQSNTAFVDPFSSAMLSREAAHKLDLYQQLFYLLQTKPDFLAKLCARLSDDTTDETRKMVEGVVLALYGYGQGKREEYWAMRFFQSAVAHQVEAAQTFEALLDHFPPFAKIAVQYVRPNEGAYIQELLGPFVSEIVADRNLDLDCDAIKLFEAFRSEQEAREGVQRTHPQNVTMIDALRDPQTRTEYVHRLQAIRGFSEKLVKSITSSTSKMPYSIRWIARELLLSLRKRFPGVTDDQAAVVIGRFIFQRFLKPAILVPETFGIVKTTVPALSRANLKIVATLIDQVSLGQLFETGTSMDPLNAYVQSEGLVFRNWLVDVADVIDVQEHLGVDEFIDVTVEPLPLSISPTDIYAIHRVLIQDLDDLDLTGREGLRPLVSELGGPPLPSDLVGRDRSISLKLHTRSAPLADPEAENKAEWSRAKRLILAVLRVQPERDIMTSLLAPVEDEHMYLWDQIVQHEAHGLPPLPGQEATYNLNDIKNLPYDEVKIEALTVCKSLQLKGTITPSDGYQAILNSIANDIRTKNRKQIQREKELKSMQNALTHLEEKKTGLEEQIEMYNAHNAQSISNMQDKGKRSSVIPLGKQFWHRRSLRADGKMPEYGSWVYEAKLLYSRGLLLSIEQYSPTQFDKMEIVFSSNEAGTFNIDITILPPGHSKKVIGKATVTMQELLQRQRDRKESVALGLAQFNVNKLVSQLNKKFYKN